MSSWLPAPTSQGMNGTRLAFTWKKAHLFKMQLRKPSEPPAKGMTWFAGHLQLPFFSRDPKHLYISLIVTPKCIKIVSNTLRFQNKGLWEMTRYDTETSVGIFHFYLKTLLFSDQGIHSQNHLRKCLLAHTVSSRLKVSRYFRRFTFLL